MLHSFIDHIVITAPSLEAGSQYVRQNLGVSMEAGGRHLRMGTHNLLLKLGNEQYLEVIAIDPHAPNTLAPLRPRWFGLDRPEASAAPCLAGWVARIDDIRTASTAVSHTFGHIEEMSRGDLDWRITIPEDGSLPFDGAAPMLIQWTKVAPPANRLRDQGCSLLSLEGFHPQAERIAFLMQTIGFKDSFVVSRLEAPGLIAHIQTPNGMRHIGTVAK